MASRAYKRDNRGRFAGGGGATVTTYGKAGGFAKGNTAGGQRASHGSLGKSLRRAATSRTSKRIGRAAGAYAAAGLGAYIATNTLSRGRTRIVRGPGRPDTFAPRPSAPGRAEAIGMGRGGSLRDIAKAQGAGGTRVTSKSQPNYAAAAGRKDAVGRSIKKHGYGLSLGGGHL